MLLKWSLVLGLVCGVAWGSAPSHNKLVKRAGKIIAIPLDDEPIPASATGATLNTATSPGVAKTSPLWQLGDIVRVPYMEHRVYKAQAAIGIPILIELPEGEICEHVWLDPVHWQSNANDKTNRLVVSPKAVPELIGKWTFLHIETSPSKLRVSFKVYAVSDEDEIPGVWQVYATGEMRDASQARQVQALVNQTVAVIQANTEETANARLESWKADAVEKLDERYKLSGNVPLDRVISDGIQTFIMTSVQERPSIIFKNKDGKEEPVNFKLENGKYVVNRVLVGSEKFILTIGKASTTIERR